MSMTVYMDPVDVPPRGDFDVASGWSPERVAKVTGVAYTGPDSHYTALQELVTAGSLPSVGSAHPTIVGATLTGYSVEMIEPGKMIARMRYRQPTAAWDETQQQQQLTSPTLRFSATLAQEQSNKDVNGRVIVVEHAGEEQSGLVTRLVPQMMIEISRMEIGSPADRIRNYIGKLNLADWRVAPADPRGTWLFIGANAVSQDFGVSYRVDYQFQYRPPIGPYSGWDQEVVFIDPTTGRPPPDVYESPGLVRVDMYAYANFNDLGLA